MSEFLQLSPIWQDAIFRLKSNRLGVFGGTFIVFLIILAILTPWIAPYDYAQQDRVLGATPPTFQHLLGTDYLGRDLLTRMLYGSRISLLVGFIATTVALIIGVTWGTVAGYLGGSVDTWMMRIVDTLYGIPFIILIILPTTGTVTVLPTYSLYLLSFGLTAIAVSPIIVSGLVVAIVIKSITFCAVGVCPPVNTVLIGDEACVLCALLATVRSPKSIELPKLSIVI